MIRDLIITTWAITAAATAVLLSAGNNWLAHRHNHHTQPHTDTRPDTDDQTDLDICTAIWPDAPAWPRGEDHR